MNYEFIMKKNNIKKSCINCEFNFKGICSNIYYGEKIKPNSICYGWNIDLRTYSLCFDLVEKRNKSK